MSLLKPDLSWLKISSLGTSDFEEIRLFLLAVCSVKPGVLCLTVQCHFICHGIEVAGSDRGGKGGC